MEMNSRDTAAGLRSGSVTGVRSDEKALYGYYPPRREGADEVSSLAARNDRETRTAQRVIGVADVGTS